MHHEWMLRSFALIFAAVMLRIQLPLLIIAFHPSLRHIRSSHGFAGTESRHRRGLRSHVALFE